VKALSEECDVVVVVGSPNSSNSNRLRELAERMGCDAYLVDTVDQLESEWFEGKHRIGVTAGASAPDILVKQVINGLQRLGANAPVELDGVEENITFSIPKELRLKSVD
jgi:4-hydroxy-3-methylbut-2-enyl diphosphate reductase